MSLHPHPGTGRRDGARDFAAKHDDNNEGWGQVSCPQTCPHLGVPEDTPLTEWLKASQRDAFGGESQPRFTALTVSSLEQM